MLNCIGTFFVLKNSSYDENLKKEPAIDYFEVFEVSNLSKKK